MTVLQNIAAAKAAKTKVLSHCMCAQFEEDATHFTVLYPPGYRVDGCRVSKSMGHAKALNMLVTKMELHWQGGI